MISELYPEAIEAIAQEDPEYAAELARKYRRAMVVLSREDPNWFCQYVLRNERTTGPIRQTDQHKLIHDHLMARDEKGNWKNLRCEVEGSKVLLASGTWLPIEELRHAWTPVLTWDTKSAELRTVQARAAYNGTQKCVCVHLENGHILRLTEHHPLLSDSWAWTQAKDLKVGQQVVTIRSVQLASTTDEREIPDDEAEILGYLLAGSLQGKNIIVRKLDRSPKWSARRAKLFEAAGWEITKHKEMTLRVTPGSGVMGPGDYLASLARFKNGWPVELMPSVWGLPASALHRLLSAFFATAFCNRKASSRGNPLGQTVGSGSDRVPLGVGHIRRETLELIRLLMLRVGARGVIRPTKMFSFSDGGGIYRKAKRKGESNKFWQLRVDPKQVGLFWPTKQVPAAPPLWAFEKIVKITRTPHKLKTWALEVQDETHSYISGGVLSHNTLIWTYPEFGKGLPLDTEIPTPDGWQAMGELRVGEQIFGSNGAPANITSVSPIHNLRIFELHLDDGDSIRCDESHRWSAYHARDRHKKDRKPRVVTALEMFESQKYGDRTAWSLPIAEPVQYPAQELPVHPYVLGAWLGDGDSCRQRLTFHKDDRAIFDRCVELCGDSGSHETPHKLKPYVISGSIGGKDFKRRLKSLGVMGRSGSKFIPAAYLRGSVEQRLELLKGLLDTDGTVAKGAGSYIEVSFSLERLARNTLELVRSLGFKAHFSSSPSKLYGRVVGTRYRVYFTARTPVFYLPRKLAEQELTGEVGGKANHRHVVKIVEMPSVPTKCITVDSPDQTYLATRSYTVTHNSNQVAIGHLLWRIGKDPNASFGIMCNSERMAAKILRSIKAYIMESLELRDVFPHLKPGDQWSESAISVERDTFRKDPTVQAISLRGKFVGARLDGLVMDDVDNVDTTLNQSARDDTERRVRTQAISRLGDVGWAVAIGNVWHEGDLMHRLAKTGWKELRFPVMNEVTGESNDPERFPLERIYAIRDEDQGPIEFQRLYMLKARIDGEQRFRKEWVEQALQKGTQQVLLTEGLPKIPSGCRTITGVDLGVKKKASSDPSAITTILEIPQDGPGQCEYILLNIQKGRWNAQEIMDKVREEQRLFASKVYVESNGCFVPGTRVLTSVGYKPIETIVPGDLVWTHAGRWRAVQERYDGNARYVTTARAKGSLPVRCTPNHAFWVRRAGRLPGRAGGHHRPVGEPGWCSIGFPDCPQYASLAMPSWPPCAPVLRLAATKKLPERELAVDETMSLALGLFMAEGHATKGQVFWTLNQREGYLADLVEGAFSACSGKFTRREGRGTLRVTLSNKQLATVLHFGTSTNKCPPLAWMGWPLKLRLAMVRGWFLGDGSVATNGARNTNPARSLCGSTISRTWALFVRTTLMEAGITVALRESFARKTSVIEGRTVRRHPVFLLNLTHDGSAALREHMTHESEAVRWGASWWDLPETTHRTSGSPIVLDDSGAWARIPAFESDPGSVYEFYDNGPVHNLVVEEDHSFTVEDFVVHNAQDFLIQLMNLKGGAPIAIEPFNTGRNKYDPMYGVESLAGEMAMGKWTIPSWDGTLESAEDEVRALAEEMLAYTPGNHTGDVLMSLWIAREGARLSRKTVESRVEFGRLRLRR